MAPKVFINATQCVTPLGFDVESNVAALRTGSTAITRHESSDALPQPYHAAAIDSDELKQASKSNNLADSYSKLEKMLLLSLKPIIDVFPVISERDLLLLSTTKGNIDALTNGTTVTESAQLATLAQTVANHFKFLSKPMVLSNACVSGIMAVAVAKRMIQAGAYDRVYVVAGDLVSGFVLSGFNSFQAMSDAPCKPYSAHRTGVSLGEAAAAVLISKEPEGALAEICGDAAINDANHISGPSRTGEGLFRSVTRAMTEAGVGPQDIDYLSAHGTATPYNDEMEAIAFNRAGLQNVPVNSLKGYYGHTLGASGLLESVIALESMQRGELYASLGFDEMGVSAPLNVIEKFTQRPVRTVLKTASGFGGCNTAVIFKKVS